ncbi:hypothetical protein HDU92_008473 [Lobulomyces angularis]|nr:hypothetical protein HDU92_008473 [Lobulomyces angularis]
MTISYKNPNDTEDIWKDVSKWTKYQCESLSITCFGVSINAIIDINNVSFPEEVENILMPDIDIIHGLNVDKKESKFYNRVLQKDKFNDGSSVDAVIYDLLSNTNYEGSGKIHFVQRPKTITLIGEDEVTSRPDFVVYADRDQYERYMIIIKNKSCLQSFKELEYQLAGELLAAVSYRADKIMKNHVIYGIIISGNLMRFYKAAFDVRYLSSLSRNITVSSVDLDRYPSECENPLDIRLYKDREMIIKILCAIKSDIEKLLEKNNEEE